jgi:hypothetical protein
MAAAIIAGLCSIAPHAPQTVLAQPDMNLQRQHGLAMLKAVKDDLKKNYYDPNFRGVDIESRFKAAEVKIKEAESVGHIFGAIAQALFELNDRRSHGGRSDAITNTRA